MRTCVVTTNVIDVGLDGRLYEVGLMVHKAM